jgi:hypothetical protein
MGEFDLRNFSLSVISALAIQSRLRRGRVVQYKTDGALALLERQLLKCENLDPGARDCRGLPFQAISVCRSFRDRSNWKRVTGYKRKAKSRNLKTRS